MKKLLAALAIICFLGIGCAQSEGPVTENKVLETTNAIYLDIRTVVTDPEMMPLFTDKELERLADLERKYLEAAKRMKTFPEDAEVIEQVYFLAGEILEILDEVTFIDKVRPYVAAIRISIQILRNHL